MQKMEKNQYIFLFKFLCLLYDKMKTYICLSVSLGSWKTWLTLAGVNQNVTDQHCDNMWGKWLLLLIQVVWVLMKVSFQPKWVFSQWKIHFFFPANVPCKSFCSLMGLLKYKLQQWRYELGFLIWVMSNAFKQDYDLWGDHRKQYIVG